MHTLKVILGAFLIFVGVVFVFGIILGISGIGQEHPKPTPTPQSVQTTPAPTAAPDPWHVTGDIAYRVNGAKFFSDLQGRRPSATFLVIGLTVRNDGKKAVMLASPKLVDDEGRRYEATVAGIEDELFLDQINPGVTFKGLVVYDVPERTDYRLVIAKDGLFGGEMEVEVWKR